MEVLYHFRAETKQRKDNVARKKELDLELAFKNHCEWYLNLLKQHFVNEASNDGMGSTQL